MDLLQKQKILSDILRIAKKDYRKKKEAVESTMDLAEAANLLKKINGTSNG